MAAVHVRSPYDMVLMAGDNIYGGWSQSAVVQRFEAPYRPLLDAGVSFFASLGNHDALQERQYPLFNMHGERYYSFTRSNVQFFALDSNYMDAAQLAWLQRALEASTARWRIAFFHHPLYSSGRRHGAEPSLRAVLEPLFVQHGVQVVFSGHDHVYERVKPQRGVTYFVCGSSGQLRRGNLDARSPVTAVGFDLDLVFMVVEIEDDVLRFQAISRTDVIVDSGEIRLGALR
jgi:3',5'-cyclic AMP phosphodiesterase CpdA